MTIDTSRPRRLLAKATPNASGPPGDRFGVQSALSDEEAMCPGGTPARLVCWLANEEDPDCRTFDLLDDPDPALLESFADWLNHGPELLDRCDALTEALRIIRGMAPSAFRDPQCPSNITGDAAELLARYPREAPA